ncbi:MAG: hypothetical protein KDD45_06520 [Bdellovibrionales bacterium]|nr:hypothetical protein [Bdellovibrionales bacterium]
MKFKKISLMTTAMMMLGQLSNAASLILNSSKLTNGKRDITITKTELNPVDQTSRFTIKLLGASVENSADITCNQDLTPSSSFKFVAPLDQISSCKTSVSNITQLHCPNGLFEVTISVLGFNCENYVNLLSKSEIQLTGSVTQEISMDDLVNVDFIIK